ncbi:MAG TPA: SRPBCC family protein [Pirellulales bacterium]|jgi:uncharacterized protein YndB with AHSA1/START domain|nr:SRPBCC family protein [Pirellulales bacterium]
MNTTSRATVIVKRRFDATAEAVFDAWLDPERAGRWLFATPTGQMVRVEIDARIGGGFEMVERRDGENIEHVGTYLEIDRPRRLVFSFTVPKFSNEATRVEIDIAPEMKGWELLLTHHGVFAEYAERTSDGWSSILDNLKSCTTDRP